MKSRWGGKGLRGMNIVVRSTIGSDVWKFGWKFPIHQTPRDNGARAKCCASYSLKPVDSNNKSCLKGQKIKLPIEPWEVNVTFDKF